MAAESSNFLVSILFGLFEPVRMQQSACWMRMENNTKKKLNNKRAPGAERQWRSLCEWRRLKCIAGINTDSSFGQILHFGDIFITSEVLGMLSPALYVIITNSKERRWAAELIDGSSNQRKVCIYICRALAELGNTTFDLSFHVHNY